MTTVLVTGGGGYVGNALVPALLRRGHSVRVLDLFLFREPYAPAERLEVLRADLRSADARRRSLEGMDAVIHLAAMSNDPSGDLDPVVTREINLEATIALATEASRSGVRRFLNTSSASVYGVREEERVTEDLEPRPQTLYARYKAETEAAILAMNGDGFEVTSVRPATLSGHTSRLRLDLTVNLLTAQAVCDGRIRVFGGAQYRPNLSVHDLVAVFLDLLERPAAGVRGTTFNLVEDNYRVSDIAERIAGVLELPGLPVESVPTDDTRSYRLCGDRALEVLGFRASHSIDHSIRAVADALRGGEVADPAQPAYRNVEYLKRWPMTSLPARSTPP